MIFINIIWRSLRAPFLLLKYRFLEYSCGVGSILSINARQCDLETNDALVGIYCKLEIYIIRFCLIIQLAR